MCHLRFAPILLLFANSLVANQSAGCKLVTTSDFHREYSLTSFLCSAGHACVRRLAMPKNGEPMEFPPTLKKWIPLLSAFASVYLNFVANSRLQNYDTGPAGYR